MPTGPKGAPRRCGLTSPPPRPTREIEQEPRDYGEALHQLHWLRLTKRPLNIANRYVVQVVTTVRAIKASAVQRGHKPMMRAIGPKTSMATSSIAQNFGNGSPLDATDAANFREVHELLEPSR